MSYEKQTWNTGDVITATKLNHIEDGIFSGGGTGLINILYDETEQNYYLDKTYNEIVSMVNSGLLPWFKITTESCVDFEYLIRYEIDQSVVDAYRVCTYSFTFSNSSPDSVLWEIGGK